MSEDLQVQMVWRQVDGGELPSFVLPDGYCLRSYLPEDKAAVFALFGLVGWPGWDVEKLRPWQWRLVPGGWFVVVEEASGAIVASAMAIHDDTWFVPDCGELGWVAVHPAHRGLDFGRIVTMAAVSRLLAIGYQHIHLYTETFRLAALKIYLSLGFVPLIDDENKAVWQEICGQLDWPFSPDEWLKEVEKLLATPDNKFGI